MKTITQQIIDNSNYTDEKEVKESIDNGYIEVYKNKAEYVEAGYDLESEDYIVLNDNKVVYFVGG